MVCPTAAAYNLPPLRQNVFGLMVVLPTESCSKNVEAFVVLVVSPLFSVTLFLVSNSEVCPPKTESERDCEGLSLHSLHVH